MDIPAKPNHHVTGIVIVWLVYVAAIDCSSGQQLGRVPIAQVAVSNPGERGLIPAQPFWPSTTKLPSKVSGLQSNNTTVQLLEHADAHLDEVTSPNIKVQDHGYKQPPAGTSRPVPPVILNALEDLKSNPNPEGKNLVVLVDQPVVTPKNLLLSSSPTALIPIAFTTEESSYTNTNPMQRELPGSRRSFLNALRQLAILTSNKHDPNKKPLETNFSFQLGRPKQSGTGKSNQNIFETINSFPQINPLAIQTVTKAGQKNIQNSQRGQSGILNSNFNSNTGTNQNGQSIANHFTSTVTPSFTSTVTPSISLLPNQFQNHQINGGNQRIQISSQTLSNEPQGADHKVTKPEDSNHVTQNPTLQPHLPPNLTTQSPTTVPPLPSTTSHPPPAPSGQFTTEAPNNIFKNPSLPHFPKSHDHQLPPNLIPNIDINSGDISFHQIKSVPQTGGFSANNGFHSSNTGFTTTTPPQTTTIGQFPEHQITIHNQPSNNFQSPRPDLLPPPTGLQNTNPFNLANRPIQPHSQSIVGQSKHPLTSQVGKPKLEPQFSSQVEKPIDSETFPKHLNNESLQPFKINSQTTESPKTKSHSLSVPKHINIEDEQRFNAKVNNQKLTTTLTPIPVGTPPRSIIRTKHPLTSNIRTHTTIPTLPIRTNAPLRSTTTRHPLNAPVRSTTRHPFNTPVRSTTTRHPLNAPVRSTTTRHPLNAPVRFTTRQPLNAPIRSTTTRQPLNPDRDPFRDIFEALNKNAGKVTHQNSQLEPDYDPEYYEDYYYYYYDDNDPSLLNPQNPSNIPKTFTTTFVPTILTTERFLPSDVTSQTPLTKKPHIPVRRPRPKGQITPPPSLIPPRPGHSRKTKPKDTPTDSNIQRIPSNLGAKIGPNQSLATIRTSLPKNILQSTIRPNLATQAPIAITQNPAQRPTTITLNPNQRPIKTTLNPIRRPVTTTLNPAQRPLTTIIPSRRPVTTVNPSRRPVTTTHNPAQRPVTTINPSQRPVTTTLDPNQKVITTTLLPIRRPITTTHNPSRRPNTAILNTIQNPIASTPNPAQNPFRTAPIQAFTTGVLNHPVVTHGNVFPRPLPASIQNHQPFRVFPTSRPISRPTIHTLPGSTLIEVSSPPPPPPSFRITPPTSKDVSSSVEEHSSTQKPPSFQVRPPPPPLRKEEIPLHATQTAINGQSPLQIPHLASFHGRPFLPHSAVIQNPSVPPQHRVSPQFLHNPAVPISRTPIHFQQVPNQFHVPSGHFAHPQLHPIQTNLRHFQSPIQPIHPQFQAFPQFNGHHQFSRNNQFQHPFVQVHPHLQSAVAQRPPQFPSQLNIGQSGFQFQQPIASHLTTRGPVSQLGTPITRAPQLRQTSSVATSPTPIHQTSQVVTSPNPIHHFPPVVTTATPLNTEATQKFSPSTLSTLTLPFEGVTALPPTLLELENDQEENTENKVTKQETPHTNRHRTVLLSPSQILRLQSIKRQQSETKRNHPVYFSPLVDLSETGQRRGRDVEHFHKEQLNVLSNNANASFPIDTVNKLQHNEDPKVLIDFDIQKIHDSSKNINDSSTTEEVNEDQEASKISSSANNDKSHNTSVKSTHALSQSESSHKPSQDTVNSSGIKVQAEDVSTEHETNKTSSLAKNFHLTSKRPITLTTTTYTSVTTYPRKLYTDSEMTEEIEHTNNDALNDSEKMDMNVENSTLDSFPSNLTSEGNTLLSRLDQSNALLDEKYKQLNSIANEKQHHHNETASNLNTQTNNTKNESSSNQTQSSILNSINQTQTSILNNSNQKQSSILTESQSIDKMLKNISFFEDTSEITITEENESHDNLSQSFTQISKNKSLNDEYPQNESLVDGLSFNTTHNSEQARNTTLSNKPYENISLDDKPLQRKSFEDEPSPEKSLDDEPLQGKSLDNEPSQGKSLDNEPSQGKSLDNEPSQAKSLDDEPSKGKSLDETSQGKLLDDEPSQGKSLDEEPSQGKSLDDEPSKGKSLDEPSQGKLLDIERSQDKTLDDRPSKGKSLDEELASILKSNRLPLLDISRLEVNQRRKARSTTPTKESVTTIQSRLSSAVETATNLPSLTTDSISLADFQHPGVKGWRKDHTYPEVNVQVPSPALSGLPFYIRGQRQLGQFFMVPLD